MRLFEIIEWVETKSLIMVEHIQPKGIQPKGSLIT